MNSFSSVNDGLIAFGASTTQEVLDVLRQERQSKPTEETVPQFQDPFFIPPAFINYYNRLVRRISVHGETEHYKRR